MMWRWGMKPVERAYADSPQRRQREGTVLLNSFEDVPASELSGYPKEAEEDAVRIRGRRGIPRRKE